MKQPYCLIAVAFGTCIFSVVKALAQESPNKLFSLIMSTFIIFYNLYICRTTMFHLQSHQSQCSKNQRHWSLHSAITIIHRWEPCPDCMLCCMGSRPPRPPVPGISKSTCRCPSCPSCPEPMRPTSAHWSESLGDLGDGATRHVATTSISPENWFIYVYIYWFVTVDL